MAFCSNCGAQATGRYCDKCGTPIGGSSSSGGGTSASTTSGLSDNVASALAYLFIPAIIFLVIEPFNRNPTVRFHSWQCIFLVIANIAIQFSLSIIGGMFLGFLVIPLQGLVSIGFLILWVILIIKAYQGQKWVLPVVGPLAENQARG